MKYFNEESSKVLNELKVDSSKGLSNSEVKYGYQSKGSLWSSS